MTPRGRGRADRPPRSIHARIAIIAAYVAIFWCLLPWVLWHVAARVDAAAGWPRAPYTIGWLVLVPGLALLAWGMAQLWLEGRGLPVSALPPSKLAARGPYKLVRHPIYLGFNVALLGAGLILGSRALAWVVAPAFAPVWWAYGAIEERGLVRRFGQAYVRYQGRVGLLPGFPWYRLGQLLLASRLLPIRVEGRENVPRRGPVALVANHACYIDFLFVAAATRRKVRFLTTAEAFRGPLLRHLLRGLDAIPLRRYRVDPVAAREALRTIADGGALGVFPEGERSALGALLPPLTSAARMLSRLQCPVVPIGISGSYDVGPRWARVLRRRPVTVRVGKPIDFAGRDPCSAVAEALAALVAVDPQPVRLPGLDRARIAEVLWRCPRCGNEQGWEPEALRCTACEAAWKPTADGWLEGGAESESLAALGRGVWARTETSTVRAPALGLEGPIGGKVRRLRPLGEGVVEVDPAGVRFADTEIPAAAIRTVTVERSDTLQVGTADRVWQFRLRAGSAFRLQNALLRIAPPPRRRSARPVASVRRN